MQIFDKAQLIVSANILEEYKKDSIPYAIRRKPMSRRQVACKKKRMRYVGSSSGIELQT
jgi:hypothetical protein